MTDDLSGLAALPAGDLDARARWRLILGAVAERANSSYRLPEQSDADPGPGDESEAGDGLSWAALDRALGFVYDQPRGADLAASAPYVPRWLGDIRRYFDQGTVALLEKDAWERHNLDCLLTEPELLGQVEKNVELVAKLLALKDLMPDRTKETARLVIAEVVRRLEERLRMKVEQALAGLRSRTRHGVRPLSRNLDVRRTLQRNLGTYQPDRRAILPERIYYWADERKSQAWDIVILVDQSGSMAESIVYSSILSAIFASVRAVRTRLVFFDTQVVDVSEHLSDPVDLIFGARLGGGTDIAGAVDYGRRLIDKPQKTIFVLISDLLEGGDQSALLGHVEALVESKVKAFCLLALTDSGRPAYNHELAAELARRGMPAFGCTPDHLVDLVEAVLRGADPVEAAGRVRGRR